VPTTSADASLNEAPRTTAICPQFSGDLFQSSLSTKFICMGPLRSPFQSDPSFTPTYTPFTTNKALSGPLYTMIGPSYPRASPVGGFRGWSAPALPTTDLRTNSRRLWSNRRKSLGLMSSSLTSSFGLHAVKKCMCVKQISW